MEKIQSQSRTLGVKRVLCYVVLVLLAIISLFPFYIMIINCIFEGAVKPVRFIV